MEVEHLPARADRGGKALPCGEAQEARRGASGKRPLAWKAVQAAIFSLCVLLLGKSALAEDPKVVASILPVHSLAAAIMAGVGEPVLLIEGAASPHSFSLRPSDARALEEADLVIWVGEELEISLLRPLQNLGEQARLITLSEIEGMKLLPSRPAGLHRRQNDQAAQVEEEHEGKELRPHSDHVHGEHDMHLWLDPENAVRAGEAIAEALAELDPQREALYRGNALRLKGELQALASRVAQKLAPFRDKGFLVFHDAYQYFEEAFSLSSSGSLTLGAERQPGARRLQEIRRWIEETNSLCLFAEPQFEPRLLPRLVEGTDARIGLLDPLGAELDPGPTAYTNLIENLASSFAGCFEGAP